MNRILPFAILSVLALPVSARASTPSAGIPQEIRSGFFADVNMGGFFTLGGKNMDGASAPSSPQVYLQLGVGYDLLKNFSLGASFGLGASAASCFGEVTSSGRCMGPNQEGQLEEVADHFTATMFTLEASYKHSFNDRLSLQPRLHLGFASLSPEPRRNDSGAAINGGPLLGAGVGVEYATRMDHFSIGADLYGRYIVGPNVFSMAVYPKIKYTF